MEFSGGCRILCSISFSPESASGVDACVQNTTDLNIEASLIISLRDGMLSRHLPFCHNTPERDPAFYVANLLYFFSSSFPLGQIRRDEANSLTNEALVVSALAELRNTKLCR
jgi:hypothetical protein